MKIRSRILTLVAASAVAGCANAPSDHAATRSYVTAAQCNAATAWSEWADYPIGAVVTYGGATYQCIQGHTSLPGWMPSVVPALWSSVTCAGGGGGGDTEAPFTVMHADLEKTVFDIDVLAVEMRFDDATEARIASLAGGQPYTRARADAVARAAAEADEAAVFVRFRRDVSLERFIDAVDADLTKALDAGMIDEARYRIVVSGMPRWFSAIEERGFEDGDELVYQASPAGLHTVLRDSRRRTLIDHIDRGPGPKRALLAAYFAPGSTFREPLVASVFE